MKSWHVPLVSAIALSVTAFAHAQEVPTAEATPETPPTAEAQPAPRQVDRIVVNGSVPIPKVGAGAPYHSEEEIKLIESEAKRSVTSSISAARDAARSDEEGCGDPMNFSAFTHSRLPSPESMASKKPGSPPSMELLYTQKKDAALRVAQLADKAAAATRKADESRHLAFEKKMDMAEVERIEIARQKEVKKLQDARQKLMEAEAAISDFGAALYRYATPGASMQDDPKKPSVEASWIDIDMAAIKRKKTGWGVGLPRPTFYEKLSIANLKADEMQDAKGFYLRVSGQVGNFADKEQLLPDLLISLTDERGLVLATRYAAVGGKTKLPPKSKVTINYDVRPSPGHVNGVIVNFASGYEPPPPMPLNLLCGAASPG